MSDYLRIRRTHPLNPPMLSIYTNYLAIYRCHWHRWVSMTPVSVSRTCPNNNEPQNDARVSFRFVFILTIPGYVFSVFFVSFRICCSCCYFFLLTWFETKWNISEKRKNAFQKLCVLMKVRKLLFWHFLASRKKIFGELLSFLACKSKL